MKKKLLRLDRLRKVPAQFSWVDQRLIRDNHICLCNPESLALYLFLITVSDVEGVSYYSDSSICKKLSMNLSELAQARTTLIKADLIAYESPFFQVLSLPDFKGAGNRTKGEGFISVKDIFQRIGGRS